MATIRQPAKDVKVCDVCKRESGYLTECIACGREYCVVCHGVFPGCMIAPDVCRDCPHTSVVEKICDEHAPGILLKRDERNELIKKLRRRKVAVKK